MSKTTENLQAAFAGESQANRKYLAFARKADLEGYHLIANLFRAAAAAETIHANNHFNALAGVKSTEENLKTAIAGENYEVVSMYPGMIADAKVEAEKKATSSLEWAFEVEKVHEALFRFALENKDPNASTQEFYVCPICGFTHIGKLEGRCPVCNTLAEKFLKVE